MRSLMILVTTIAVVSGLRDATPGFAVDYRSFGGSSVYQDLPYREQARSFREAVLPSGQHGPQSFRQESFREYRQPFVGFRDDTRSSFKDETRIYEDNNRDGFKEELRNFHDEARPFRDDSRLFKGEIRGFREDTRGFRDEKMFRDEIRGMRDGPRHFRDERPLREEQRPFREDIRNYRDGTFRDEHGRPFRDDVRTFEGPRSYRDELRPFRNDVRHFREEPTIFRDDRPFREESGPLRNEARPFREESRPFKDELLFTQESQTLAEAQHRFNKEQNRQPLSFGGHSNYLKYGNHGLGFASVPSAILPLEDNSPSLSSEIMMSEMSTTAATQSPNFLKSGIPSTSTPSESIDTKNHITVTIAPDVGSTPSHTESVNTIDGRTIGQQRTNDNLLDGRSTSSTSNAVTISTSGSTSSVTPNVLYTPGSASMSSSPLGINGVNSDSGGQQTRGASTNSLHPSKQGLNVVATPSSYFPSETSGTVPETLLNYVFKYQLPDDTKARYTYGNTLRPESFNQIQAMPLIHHHQTAKYAILPELKISGITGIQQSGAGAINYVSTPGIPKVPYLTANSPALTLGAPYSTENVPVNFAPNLLQIERDSPYSQIGHAEQMNRLHGQTDQYSQLRQIAPNEYLTQLGQYGVLGQGQQTRNVPFAQGGLQLQLGGFGGIDYNGLSGNSEGSRGTPAVNFGLTESSGPAGSTFAKMSLGEPLWQLQ